MASNQECESCSSLSSRGSKRLYHMLRLLLAFAAMALLLGCSRKPHGRYVAEVSAGSSFVELSYDFREDGVATTWILSNGAAVAAQGRWKTKGDAVLFEGVAISPISRERVPVSHILHFDGDDLFRDDLSVRFVRQK